MISNLDQLAGMIKSKAVTPTKGIGRRLSPKSKQAVIEYDGKSLYCTWTDDYCYINWGQNDTVYRVAINGMTEGKIWVEHIEKEVVISKQKIFFGLLGSRVKIESESYSHLETPEETLEQTIWKWLKEATK